MSSDNDEVDKKFQQAAKEQLDLSTEQIDAETLARLRQARVQALTANEHKERRSWQPVFGGFATASVAVVVAFIWLGGDRATMPVTSGFEDMEMLSSAETIEFYEDYEFYQWLEDEDMAG